MEYFNGGMFSMAVSDVFVARADMNLSVYRIGHAYNQHTIGHWIWSFTDKTKKYEILLWLTFASPRSAPKQKENLGLLQ